MKSIVLCVLAAAALILAPVSSFAEVPPSYITQWGTNGSGPGQMNQPHGLAVDRVNGFLYLTDTGNSRVEKFSLNGSFVQEWPSSPSVPFGLPWDVAIGTNGNVFACDINWSPTAARELSPTGSPVREFVNPNVNWPTGHQVNGVAVAQNGDVFTCVTHQSSRYVLRFDSQGALLQTIGSAGSGDGQFGTAYGIAISPAGELFVTDNGQHRVVVFSSSGQYVRQWGTQGSGDGQLLAPNGIAVGPDGAVYVADTGNHRIQKFTSDGTFLSKWGLYGLGSGQFNGPTGVDLDALGNVYVADNGNNRIQKFGYIVPTEPPPPFVLKWGTTGSGDGQFIFPWGVAIDQTGNVFVTDGNHRVEKFTPTGGFLGKWGSSGTGPGQFNNPTGVATDQSGNVYVADLSNHRIQKFSNDGLFLAQWGSFGNGDGQFFQPFGIAIDQQGNVYVSDGNDRIQKFTSNGEFLTKWSIPNSSLWGIATDGTGNILVADAGSERVLSFTSDGVLLRSWPLFKVDDGLAAWPTDIVVDNVGNILVTQMSHSGTNHRIQMFRSDGELVALWGSFGQADGQFNQPVSVDVDVSGNLYIVDRANSRIQKFGPGGPTGPGGLAPVVLVHGYCSDSQMWDELKVQLQSEGFQVLADLNLTPNDERPHIVAAQLEQKINSIPGSGSVAVVTHSMGGLVARIAAKNLKEVGGLNRIKTLVTLGTPHHGSDIAGLVAQDIFYRGLASGAFPWGCKPNGPAIWDLVPGSNLLNTLNYGYKGDEYAQSTKGSHLPERVDDPLMRIATIAGTKPANFVQRLLFSKAWATSHFGQKYGIPEYTNDGAVGIDAARLYYPQAEYYTDQSLGIPQVTHSPGTGSPSFESSPQLVPIIANILRGGIPTVVAPEPLLVAVTEQANDTTLVDLSSPSGSISPGSVQEHAFSVPTTTFLRVLMTSTDARLFLGSPTDPSITPDDTLTTPGLQYVYDSALGLEGYLFENPTAGNWTLRVDGTAATQTQEYATAISIASTNAIAIAATPLYVLAGDSVVVRARITNLGTPIPGVTWNVTVIRPDSTTFPLALYDDGAHSDSLANDGVFGAIVHPTGSVGFFELEAGGTLPSGGPTLVAGTVFELATFQDLAVDTTLVFSKNLIAAGDSVMVTATVRNLGAGAVQNIAIEFWDNAAKFKTDSLDLAGNGSGTVAAQWLAASPDSHTIRVTVSPFTLPSEAQYANNTTTKLVVLGVPVGVGDLPQPRLWLAPPQPNPSNGTVTFRFGLPSSQPAALDLYDLQGRKVRSWQWEVLPPGNHAITWDGRSEHGAPAATGMYFLKFTAGGRTMTQKVVRLR